MPAPATFREAAAFPVEDLLAARLGVLSPNPIADAMAKGAALGRQGFDVMDFSVGEPDFDTPDNIQDAAVAAMRRGETRYTATDGTPALKQAIQAKFRRENGLSYGLDQITIGSGAKQVIYNAFQATLDPGDEVIVPAPYWTTYPEAVLLCGGTPRIVECDGAQGFKLAPGQLQAALTPRTKWLILNSPSNPSGAVYDRAELAALGQVIAAHPRLLVMADDMYEHMVYRDEPFATLAQLSPALFARTLTVNGVSKTYAMTGWRLGYAGGPAPLIRAIAKVLVQASSHPSSISQAAAVEAMNGPQDGVATRRQAFRARRDLIVAGLSGIPGLICTKPDGAFYVYVDCSGVIGKRTPEGKAIRSDVDFADYLLEAWQVVAVHGVAFGLSPYLRLSYATSDAAIEEGCRRIREAVAALA